MKATSEKFKIKAESSTGARYYLRILANGTEITDDIDNFYYSNIVNADSHFSIGNTASAMITFSINEPSRDIEGLELKISQGIDIDGTVEYVDLGVFKVLKPTDDRNVYQYQCVDRMTYLMDTDYVSTLSLPTTDIAMLKDICSQVGITLVENGLISHSINFIPSGYTKREIIGYMAQLQGKNAVINSDGNLELVGYSATDFVVDDNKIYYDGTSEVTSETNFVVEYVSCTVYDEENVTELVSGSGDMGIVLENPFMTQAILNEVYNKLKGFSFGIGEFEFLGDFRLEVGDIVTVETNGNTYTIPIMQIEHKSDGGVVTTITSIGQTTTEDGINSTSPTDRLIRRLNLQIRDSRKLIGENYERIIEQGTEIEVVQGKIENKIWQEDIINNYTTGSKEGNPILLTDSADSNLIDFTAYGASEQKQGNFFDGELLNGYYNSSDGNYVYQASGRICSKNSIPCKSGDVVKIVLENNVSYMYICYYSESGFISMLHGTENSNFIEKTMPDGATRFTFWAVNSGMTVNTVGTITVTVNGSTSYPSPSNPQEILSNGHRGYFDGELLQGLLEVNGTVTTVTTAVTNKNPIPCNGGDTVKLIYDKQVSAMCIGFFDKAMSPISRPYGANVSEYEYVAPTNAKYVKFDIRDTDGITPQTAKHICVTINGMYALIVKNVDKNFLEPIATNTVNGIRIKSNDDKSVTLNGTSTATVSYGIYVALKKGKYILNGNDGSVGNAYHRVVANGIIYNDMGNGVEFELTEDAAIIYQIMVSANTTVNNLTFYPMIRLAEITDDTYVPHEEKTTYIPLTEPLRSVGEVKDSAKKVDGVYGEGRKIKSRVFDGSTDEGWLLNGQATNSEGIFVTIFQITDTDLPSVSATDNNKRAMSDKLTSTTRLTYQLANSCCVSNNQRLFICLEGAITLADFKDMLANNPITVQYELAEETFTPFADQSPFYEMKTFDGVTLISSDAEMEVEYYRSTDDGKRIGSSYTLATQTANKISWIVSGGDNSSSFTLTDRMAEIIAETISLNGNVKVNGDMLVDGSVTVDKINVDNLGAISAKIGKLTIDSKGILTSEFLYEKVIEEGSLVDDYININYEYWAPSVNDYKVVSGKTTLGFEDMVFQRINGYTDPHYTMVVDGVNYPLTSDETIASYSANGLERRTNYKSEGSSSSYMTLALSGLTFKDTIGTDNMPYTEAILNSSLLRVYGDVIFSKSVKTMSGVDLEQCLRVLGTHSVNVNFASTEASGRASKTVLELGRSYPTAAFFVITHSANSDWVVLHPVGWNNTEKSSVIINYQNFYTSQLTGAVNVIVVGT